MTELTKRERAAEVAAHATWSDAVNLKLAIVAFDRDGKGDTIVADTHKLLVDAKIIDDVEQIKTVGESTLLGVSRVLEHWLPSENQTVEDLRPLLAEALKEQLTGGSGRIIDPRPPAAPEPAV